MSDQPDTIRQLLEETREFPPDSSFKEKANVSNPDIYEQAVDIEDFWEAQAGNFEWFQKWNSVLEWDLPFSKWFTGATTNITYNCLDRHVNNGGGNKIAYYWEGEPGDSRTLTYSELLDVVCQTANTLEELGVRKGDRVAIYLGMIPEMAISMLACARIGAPHTVVFGGFSAESLSDRMNDCQASLLITADGQNRGGKQLPLKTLADEALERSPSCSKMLVVRRTGQEVAWNPKTDVWWHEIVPKQASKHVAPALDSEHMLYLLYTSGTTGKPKGIVHTTGGYMVGTATTHSWVFDIKPSDVYWCAADCGWVTGHSYIVYGPLANHTTSVLYEGAPSFPGKDRWWSIVEKYGVTILYCAPTAIRTFMKWGDGFPKGHDLSSLRLLGSVGEPINPQAWMWYYETIGGTNCPIVDTWWQTETGMIMITPLPGITTLKPGSATKPFPGVCADVVDDQGQSVKPGAGGYLVLKKPWPAMLRGIYGDSDRYEETYWSQYQEKYFTGDGARKDKDGYYWLLGRVDDVMSVSGHRISTTEVESALVDHKAVAEAAVVGRSDERTGQAIAAFVVLKSNVKCDNKMIDELRTHVATKIGPIAKPASIVFADDLPKTRSGKIMRRLLKDISEDGQLGDITTLANAEIVKEIAKHSRADQHEGT